MVLDYWHYWNDIHKKRRLAEEELINSIRTCVIRIWPFSRLEVFGSWASGLPGSGSDIDLVVCFSDECQTLPTITGVIPLLQGLANFLEKDAEDFITIKKVLLHTRVPLIKAEGKIYLDKTNGYVLKSNDNEAICCAVSLDISIDGPEHSGLATTAVTECMLKILPGIGPVATLLKEYLKLKGLCDAYTGGLPSYGVVLLVLLLFLRRYQASKFLNSHSSLPEDSTEKKYQSILESSDDDLEKRDTIAESLSLTIPSSPKHQHQTLHITTSSSSSNLNPISRPIRRGSEGHIIKRATKTGKFSSSKNEICYHWSLIESQKEFGRRVAAKLLGENLDNGSLSKVGSPVMESKELIQNEKQELPSNEFELSLPIDQLSSPILGIIVVEFLGFYGDGLECGRHGFSVRDGGFRFDMHESGVPKHPQATHPLIIEDPVNVMNNVAKNSYNASAVQRAFLDADEKFKNVVTRYSGRIGSALAHSTRSSGGSVIKEMFGLCIPKQGLPSTSNDNNLQSPRFTTDSTSKNDSEDGPLQFSFSEDETQTIETNFELNNQNKLNESNNNEINSNQSLLNSELQNNKVIRGEAEYRKALNDMLLLQFHQFPDIGRSLFHNKSNKSTRRYSV